MRLVSLSRVQCSVLIRQQLGPVRGLKVAGRVWRWLCLCVCVYSREIQNIPLTVSILTPRVVGGMVVPPKHVPRSCEWSYLGRGFADVLKLRVLR